MGVTAGNPSGPLHPQVESELRYREAVARPGRYTCSGQDVGRNPMAPTQFNMSEEEFGVTRHPWFILPLLVFGGCAATGDNLRSNVYTAGQVNSQQAATMIEILTVMPAQVVVDNSEQKRKAQLGGATLGALAGGLGGGFGGLSAGGTAGTTIAGGVVGGVAGSMVSDTVLVEGVTIAYRYEPRGQIVTSSQVGKLCEYQAGNALVVSTSATETRVQPNAVCPASK